ncbi:hypothetical protein [Devosia sp. A449]
MPTHIGLSDERADQLKALAKSLGITTAEAVGFLLNRAIDDNLIPREISGFDIRADGGQVKFEITDPDDERSATLMAFATMGTVYNDLLSPVDARALADSLERLATDVRYKAEYVPMAPYNLARVGTGIRISSFMDRKRVVPKDVARDLTKMLRLAADEAEQTA